MGIHSSTAFSEAPDGFLANSRSTVTSVRSHRTGIAPQLSFTAERRKARQGQKEKPVRSASFKVAFFCRCDIIKSAPAG